MSKIKQRSGNAIVQYAGLIDYIPETIIQVGVGQHFDETIPMKAAWPGAEFIGFEPHPGIVRQIINEYPGTMYERAIGEKRGVAKLYAKRNHKDGSSLYPHATKHTKEDYAAIEVVQTTLNIMVQDKRLAGIGKNVLLWLDCEGSEANVLRGAGHEFMAKVAMVNVEMTSNPPGDGWGSPSVVHQLLHLYGFARAWIHTTRSVAGQYDAIYVRRSMLNPAYCCCPCELGK